MGTTFRWDFQLGKGSFPSSSSAVEHPSASGCSGKWGSSLKEAQKMWHYPQLLFRLQEGVHNTVCVDGHEAVLDVLCWCLKCWIHTLCDVLKARNPNGDGGRGGGPRVCKDHSWSPSHRQAISLWRGGKWLLWGQFLLLEYRGIGKGCKRMEAAGLGAASHSLRC